MIRKVAKRMLSRAAIVEEGDILDRYAKLLRECGELQDYDRGKRVHEKLVREGLFGRYLGNLLVEMYGKCGCLREAWAVFMRIGRKNVYSWNLMATAYVQNGRDAEAIQLYRYMCLLGSEIDEFTILAVLAACTSSACLGVGKSVHESIRWSGIVRDVVVGGALVTMYGRCGSAVSAREVFDGMSSRSMVTWNAMLAAYSQNSLGIKALNLYRDMLQAGVVTDTTTLVTVLSACASLGFLEGGRAVHERIRWCGVEGDVNVGNTLISFYGKCGDCVEASRVFDGMVTRNVISWTAIISAHGQNGHHRKALELFQEMDVKQVDCVILIAVLDSCSSLCELGAGRRIHSDVRKTQGHLLKRVAVGNSLLQLYGRCGEVEDARATFREMDDRDLQSWGLLIAAYAQNGGGEEALQVYMEMLVEGLEPSPLTMTNVLDACSHLGLVRRAQDCFAGMFEDHRVMASVEHYGCMVDLLGRVGRLDEAQELVEEHLPCQADAVMWLILLSACKVHGDVHRGMFVASQLSRMDEKASASYVLMSNSMMNSEDWT